MGPRLDVHHLQMLTAIAETGSLAEAAQLLGVTPSALSHRIREAERRLEVALFTKLGRGLRPTPAAELLRQAAVRILAELEQVEAAAENMSRGVRHVVRLVVGAYSSYHWLPAFLEAFRRAAPETQVEVVANAVFRPLDALQEGEIDVAIVSNQPMPAGLHRVPLFRDELVAIMAPGHRLAAKAYATPEDFVEEDMLTYSLTTLPGYEIDRFWRPSGLSPRRFIKVELVEAIVELVKAGTGVSMLTRWAMAPHLSAGTLACAQLGREGIYVGWSAVLREADRRNSPAQVLAAALAEWCAEDGRGFGVAA